jgi:hypothetical protein
VGRVCESHHESRHIGGSRRLDPPYILEELICPLRQSAASLDARRSASRLAYSWQFGHDPLGFALRCEALGISRRFMGSWRNWQTRKVEGLVPARACWFNSSRAHWMSRAESRESIAKRPGGEAAPAHWLLTLDSCLLTLLILGLETKLFRVPFLFQSGWRPMGS